MGTTLFEGPSTSAPTAITRPADSREVLCGELQLIHEQFVASEKKCLQRAIEGGRKLKQLKVNCAHGQWLPTLQKIGISRQRAAEWMILAEEENSLTGMESVREALAAVSSTHDSGPQEPRLCRPCRTTGVKSDCKECAKLNKASADKQVTQLQTSVNSIADSTEDPGPGNDGVADNSKSTLTDCDGNPVPPRLIEVFEHAEIIRRAIIQAGKLAGLLESVEDWNIYKAAVRKQKGHRQHSSYVRAAQRALQDVAAARLCPSCKGEEVTPKSTEPCKMCDNRGYLTEAEVKSK